MNETERNSLKKFKNSKFDFYQTKKKKMVIYNSVVNTGAKRWRTEDCFCNNIQKPDFSLLF